MKSILDIKPELIRIKTDRSGKCVLCDKQSEERILSENNKKVFFCRDHFEALCTKLKNFH
ncbi:hypothetical protein CEE45_10135 [Candidatus Heimdallarchaeota archaeon B3_Heim]|nr:MAG: hypothetical protein CEE45_10135 [Candidatus Heimdallarchaeota archaeon B3_Heim]